MSRHLFRSILLLVLCGTVAIGLSRCSLIGLGIGAAASSSPTTVPGWDVTEVPPGKKVEIVLNNGSLVLGTFAGVQPRLDRWYAPLYEEWNAEQALPSLGDTLLVRTTPGTASPYGFMGVDYAQLVLLNPSGERVPVPLSRVEAVTSMSGSEYELQMIRHETTRGTVPLRSRYVIASGSNTAEFDPRQVNHVVVKGAKHQLTGFLVGAAIDAAILIAAAASLNDWGSSSSSSSTESCPFIYQWTGDGYELAGEIYAGAVFEPLERDDYLPLSGLVPDMGHYRIRVSNELPERQFINRIDLIEAWTPPGSRSLMDRHGGIYTVRDPQPPRSAIANGLDVSESVREADGALHVFPASEGPMSSLDLTFVRPPGEEMATLVVRAKNTMWLDFLFQSFLMQFGSSYDRWVRRMNRRSTDELRAWVRDQSFTLAVHRHDAGSWVYEDHFEMVGPLTQPREMALHLDMSDMKTDTLHLRLSTGYRFWELDYVAVEFGSKPPQHVRHLSAAVARTRGGEDVAALLAETDDRYLVQEELGEATEIFFPVSKSIPGLERSVFLQARGYYRPLRDYSGVPSLAEVRTFREPGRFPQYSVETYWRLIDEISQQYSSP